MGRGLLWSASPCIAGDPSTQTGVAPFRSFTFRGRIFERDDDMPCFLRNRKTAS
jgi:hypothetical protein